MTGDFPFSTFLEEEPRATYFGQSGRFGAAPRQQKYFEGAFQSVYDQYLGRLGEMANQGDPNVETFRFNDWLKNDFGFGPQWRGMTPKQRGENPSQFAPGLKWFR